MNVTKATNSIYGLYLSFLTIAWMFLNFGGSGADPYTGQGLRWVLITVPLLFIIFIFTLVRLMQFSFDNNLTQIFLLLYILCIIPGSAIHSDLKHLSEVLRWALPLYFIIHFRISVSYKLLNFLYILSVIVVVLNYNSGVSDYGYLPGQTTVNLHQGMWWRVSLWLYKTPPYSAAFSIAILLVNFFYNKKNSRYFFYILSTYFIILSGSRTSYLILIFTVIFLFLKARVRFGCRPTYLIFPIIVFSTIFLLQVYSENIGFSTGSEFINSAITRSVDGSANLTLNSRLLIIAEHYRLLLDSDVFPFLGIGSKVNDSPNWTVNGGFFGGTADSFISHLMVRDGIAFIFLWLGFCFFLVSLLKEKNVFGYMVAVILMIFLVAYGAWLNFSNPVFLMYCGMFFIRQDFSRDYSANCIKRRAHY
ncbi:hypothetical protein [Desulfuromonas sp. DDH964]|uniref:hypothetical protein n=1 Tax=Desulfuromonas sp. DDH964 TaxID=1823759 RepID=UPI00078E5CD7|nr:hypothetical protein [Desulfuromonas sp. DDH964]AMV71861.1 hypothetical protein DBW_1499 [Desulfuromonas sp. DDH964]